MCMVYNQKGMKGEVWCMNLQKFIKPIILY